MIIFTILLFILTNNLLYDGVIDYKCTQLIGEVVDEQEEYNSPLHFASLYQVTYGGMTMRRSLTVVLFLVIFLLWNTPTVIAQFQEAGIEKLRVAVEAPDFSLKELGGEKISLKEMRGKIILLNFFATW